MSSEESTPQSTPDDSSRRAFLTWSVTAISIVWAGLFGWPLAASLIGPMSSKLKRRFFKVAALDAIPNGAPVQLSFPYVGDEGFIAQTQTQTIWVVKQSDSNLAVLSPICPHLACRINWSAGAQHFVCPCHGSVFSVDGHCLAGPSPRPMDTLEHRIEDGQLMVQWEQFQSGVAEKISL